MFLLVGENTPFVYAAVKCTSTVTDACRMPSDFILVWIAGSNISEFSELW